LAPLNRGGLNSTHFHGTHVPVEEPSTASKADMCDTRKNVRFGPKAEVMSRYFHVRFTPESGHVVILVSL
jgi:hypothetical protein